MADKTLKSKYQRLSILKYLYETVGDEGGAGFHIITNSQQYDFEALKSSYGGWIMTEVGLGVIKPKMTVVMLITCCSRANDSEDQLDTMKDSVRDAFAPGTIFPHYDTDNQVRVGGFIVHDCMEGPAVEQPGGGFNVTYTVVLKVGVVV